MIAKFSLVVGTLGRTRELKQFLASLKSQRYRHFELIVVDQNSDDRAEILLHQYARHFPIRHLRAEPGLSRARNLGLRSCRGDIIAFPDDDCWYSPTLLEDVARHLMNNRRWSGVSGRCLDKHGKDTGPKFDRRRGALNRYNVWSRGISTCLFLRRETINVVGEFDETLGLGSGTPYGSGEETDYLIRVVKSGFHIEYLPTLSVFHPRMNAHLTTKAIVRGYAYGAGMGRVLQKHEYPIWFKVRSLIRPLAGSAVSLACFRPMKACLHFGRCLGRLRGLLSQSG